MTFSVYSATDVNEAAFYATMAESSKFLISGGGHAIYGQPAASAANYRSADRPTTNVFAKRRSEVADRGE